MVLETSTPDVNVKNIVIEAPSGKPELPFNAEREISAAQWSVIMDEVDSNAAEGGDIAYFLPFVFPLSILDSRRLDKYRQNPGIFDRGIKEIKHDKLGKELVLRLEHLLALRLLFPDKIDQLGIDSTLWDEAKDYLKGTFGKGDSGVIADYLVYLKLLFPNGQLDKTDLAKARKILRSRINEKRDQFYLDYSSEAAAYKLYFPERISDINMDGAFWQGIRKKLPGLERKTKALYDFQGERDFVERAANMKILAASGINITASGMELSFSDSNLHPVENPVPEVRKF